MNEYNIFFFGMLIGIPYCLLCFVNYLHFHHLGQVF